MHTASWSISVAFHSRTVDVAAARGFSEVVALIDKAIEARQSLTLSEGPLRRACAKTTWPPSGASSRRDPSAVNTTDEDGNTPLHLAAQAEDTADSAEFMKFLLDHGAALDVPNQLGFTPVYVTLFRNHPYTYARPRWGLFELLLARGAPYDINLACVKGDIDKVRSLLAADAGAVHFQAPCKKRPLSCAAEFGRRDIVALLAGRGRRYPTPRKPTCYRTFPLVAAAKQNDLAMVQMLLEHGANPNAQTDGAEVALLEAIEPQPRHGEPDCLLRRIAADSLHGHRHPCGRPAPEPEAGPVRHLYPQSRSGRRKLSRRCGWHCITASTQKTSASGRCSAPAPTRSCCASSSRPAPTRTSTTRTAATRLLHFLTVFPDTMPSMEVLLQFKANINARDNFFGFTPLTWAVVHRRLDMVQFLLAHGAAIELPDDQPWTTPRFWAKHLEEPAIMQAFAD